MPAVLVGKDSVMSPYRKSMGYITLKGIPKGRG